MVNIKIEELPEFNPERTDVAKKIFNVEDPPGTFTTYKVTPENDEQAYSDRVPTNTHFVKSEADIIDEIGAAFEIPVGESHTIYFDDSFTFTKGFKLNTGSSLSLRSRSKGVLCTFSPANDGEALISGITSTTVVNDADILDELGIISTDSTSPVFDLLGNFGATTVEVKGTPNLNNFFSFGHIKDFGAVALDTFAIFGFSRGLIMEDCVAINITAFVDIPTSTTSGRVSLSIIASSGFVSTVNISRTVYFIGSGEAALYLDGGTINAATRFEVDNANVVGAGGLYKKMNDGDVTSITDNAGAAQFNSTAHGLIDDDLIDSTDFPESSYNDTGLVVENSLANSYELVGITFVTGTETNTGKFSLINRPIFSVTDNGGKARFNVTNSLISEEVVNLNNFTTPTTDLYNVTIIPTAVDSAFFDTDIDFETPSVLGNFNSKSRDEIDPQVNSVDNPGEPDSMTIAEMREGNAITVDSVEDTEVAIQNATPVSGDFIQDVSTERFSIATDTGIITYDGLETVSILLQYQLTATKVSGADQSLLISLRQNDVKITKTEQPLTAIAAPGGSLLYFGILSVSPSDTFQLFLNNTTNSIDTDISELKAIILRN